MFQLHWLRIMRPLFGVHKRFAYPEFNRRDVAEIDTALVMRCLEPIWRSKTETAAACGPD
jgi:hypothetical protein